jgi:putative membrane protein
MRLLLHWILSALALLAVTRLVDGFRVAGFGAALIAALVIGLVNGTLGAVLKFVTFPINFATLGIFGIVVNAAMLRLAAALVPGFAIDGFLPAFLGALVLSLLNLAIRGLTQEKEKDGR